MMGKNIFRIIIFLLIFPMVISAFDAKDWLARGDLQAAYQNCNQKIETWVNSFKPYIIGEYQKEMEELSQDINVFWKNSIAKNEIIKKILFFSNFFSLKKDWNSGQ